MTELLILAFWLAVTLAIVIPVANKLRRDDADDTTAALFKGNKPPTNDDRKAAYDERIARHMLGLDSDDYDTFARDLEQREIKGTEYQRNLMENTNA